MDRTSPPTPAPGSRIELEGTLNLRDLGGWTTPSGKAVIRGTIFRSDRLSTLTDADHRRLDALGIRTVVDLRYDAEVAADPSLLWGTVTNHVHLPIAGDLAQQKSFIDRVFEGELTDVTDDDVAASYVEMLERYGREFGQAAGTVVAEGPALFHCSAGKDRTGLLAMLLLGSVGVSDDDIMTDFGLSNLYRAEARMTQLRPDFEARGLDIERFRPALSAPLPALVHAMSWIRSEFGSPRGYLEQAGGLGADELAALDHRLVGH